MTAVNFNMRLDSELKDQASEVLENYGLSVPQAFKLFLNQVVKTKTVPLSFDWGRESQLTPKVKEMESGNSVMFDSVNEMMESLHEKN